MRQPPEYAVKRRPAYYWNFKLPIIETFQHRKVKDGEQLAVAVGSWQVGLTASFF
jgi:hypothetical protein